MKETDKRAGEKSSSVLGICLACSIPSTREKKKVCGVQEMPCSSFLLDSVCGYLYRAEEWPADELLQCEIALHRHPSVVTISLSIPMFHTVEQEGKG